MMEIREYLELNDNKRVECSIKVLKGNLYT